MVAKLINCSIPAKDPKTLTDFYSKVFGNEFGRALSPILSFQTWISAGVKLIVNQRQHPDETVTFTVAVDNLDDALATAKAAGAVVQWGPSPLTVAAAAMNQFTKNYTAVKANGMTPTDTMGQLVIIDDPAGNVVCMAELEGWAQALFANGEVSQAELKEHQLAIKTGQSLPA